MPPLPREIERKYLLRGVPALPPEATAVWIEQGYLPHADTDTDAGTDTDTGTDTDADTDTGTDTDTDAGTDAGTGTGGDAHRHGRLRRKILADGSAKYTHTVKTGAGLVRTEVQRQITKAEFLSAWPATRGGRIRKTRHSVPVGALTWEIDVFDDVDLVLAEVELPTPETVATPPAWLAPLIDREVTDEPAYTNAEIARRVGKT